MAATDRARPPLSVLDLSPVPSGGTPATALRRTLELARAAERLGYARYWLAEHHLNPGVAGSSPHVLMASVAAATSTIRVGTAVTILGGSTPLGVAEATATVAALHPGRVDIGLGRSGSSSAPPGSTAPPGGGPPRASTEVVDGVVLPAPVRPDLSHPRWAAQARLTRRTAGDADRFGDDVGAVLALLEGRHVEPGGYSVTALPVALDPGARAHDDVQVWLHGSSAGTSAQLAGELGLRFGANYHVAPAAVLDAVAAYRASFRASGAPERPAAPHVVVSADVVVAETDAAAAELAAGYGAWVWSIRHGGGAIPYPSPGEARAAPLSRAQRAQVADRLDTQLVGSPSTVVDRLDALARLTGADELLVTTTTHEHADRVRSYELLATAWAANDAGAVLRAAS